MAALRGITNSDQPFVGLDGQPVAGLAVSISLVDSDRRRVRMSHVDGLSVAGSATLLTDAAGVFAGEVVTNEGGSPATLYFFQVDDDYTPAFYAAIPAGSAPMLWGDLLQSAEPLPPGEPEPPVQPVFTKYTWLPKSSILFISSSA